MNAREPFDLARTPLLPGTSLIEASAGTGKTFTIVGLFLRLILECDLSVRQILVVTFTDAATEELRARIRDRLAEAAAAFALGGKTKDPVLREILRPHLPEGAKMIARLDRALCGFDEAPIFTIHGFCQRTLRDRAFESGALFDTKLLKDDSLLLQEIADDFWRRHFYEAASLPVQFLLQNKYQPETFLPLLRIRNRHPKLTVISRVEQDASPPALARLSESFRKAQHLWPQQQAGIRAAFGDSLVWGKGKHAQEGMADAMWTALATCLNDGTRTPDSLRAIHFFAADALHDATNASGVTPQHEFFERCQEVVEAERDYRISLHIEFLDDAIRELPRRKQQLKVQSYDDLLTRLHEALRSPGGSTLAAKVRAKYPAALIDEFQDTDPVQWEIFRDIFGKQTGGGVEGWSNGVLGKLPNPITPTPQPSISPSLPPLLFLIGDPKQAIYGFRGADVFTYLDAAAAVDRSHTLGRNFRSESALVRAVNTIFSAVESPFLFDEIQFQPVEASDRADQQPLTENGERSPPMHLWFMPCDPDANHITKDKAEAILPEVVSAEIARLLNGDTRLGATRLSPRDIAVLVPENRHANLMQEALRARNIPSVLYTEESVFASREARELERVLAAIAQPSNEKLARAALATELLGINGPALEALMREESAWQSRLEQFLGSHTVWQEQGFTPMFRHWLQDEAIRQRLLKFSDGERRLTNVLHLGEVLHQATLEYRLGPTGLVRWLAAQIAGEEKAAEEHQLRLERDDQAVKLVTIHKSKGLEYPIVFCPFSWKSSETRRGGIDPVFYHERTAPDTDAPGRATRFFCDLGSPEIEAHRDLAFAERLAENLRLLYVALTRARNRCYFVWGTFRGAGTSAAAWLFHPPPQPPGPRPSNRTDCRPVSNPEKNLQALGIGIPRLQEAMTTQFKYLSDAAMLADLQRLVVRSAEQDGVPAIVVQPLPPALGLPYRPPGETTEMLMARSFTGRIPRDWRMISFSGLAAGRAEETPDYDATPDDGTEPAEPAAEPQGIFAFPRGTKAGTCLHKIFEALDFQERDEEALRLLVREKLSDHGFAVDEFGEAICAMVRRTLAVPLAADRPGFTLANVPVTERLHELEFQFPIERLTPKLLQMGFAGAGSPPEFLAQLARLDFQAVGGFVKGFIDLVFRFDGRFYIVDWKSNWLGPRVEDYGPATLARTMAEHFYTLQYHLYTVALHRYLQLRMRGYDYNQHFGGVRYLFLRGLDPACPERGVFGDRPTAAWVAELSAQLAGGRNEITA